VRKKAKNSPARSSMFQEKRTPAVAASPVSTRSVRLMPSAARW
jgi:hypothetical protein